MTIRRPRSIFKRQRQQQAIARSYTERWRPADPAELQIFLDVVNACRRRLDFLTDEYEVDERTREVSLVSGREQRRIIVRPGVNVAGRRPVKADDVEVFEIRRAPE